MSIEAIAPVPNLSLRQRDAAARRARLFRPVNGRDSSDLDIVSDPVARRIAAEHAAAERKTKAEREEAERIKRLQEQEVARCEARIGELVELIKSAETELRALCEKSLRDNPRAPPLGSKFSQIVDVVTRFYSVHTIHIVSQQRIARIARPRHVIMFLACEYTGLSTPQIGRRIGGRDHSTVVNGRNRIRDLLEAGDPLMTVEIASIKKILEIP